MPHDTQAHTCAPPPPTHTHMHSCKQHAPAPIPPHACTHFHTRVHKGKHKQQQCAPTLATYKFTQAARSHLSFSACCPNSCHAPSACSCLCRRLRLPLLLIRAHPLRPSCFASTAPICNLLQEARGGQGEGALPSRQKPHEPGRGLQQGGSTEH